MNTTIQLTEASKSLFVEFAEDAYNWSGYSLVNGNVSVSKAQRGNLSDLVQKGLITVSEDAHGSWVKFTEAGREFAATLDIDLSIFY